MRVLGPLVVGSDSDNPVDIGGPKQRTALAALCLAPGRPVSVDRLIQAVWGEPVPDRARQTLAVYMSNLRSLIGAAIEWNADTYTLQVPESDVDWCAFAAAVESSEDLDAKEAGEVLKTALSWWRGEAFQGLEGHGVFRDTVSKLEALRLRAELGVAEAELARHDPAMALSRTSSLVRDHEFDERVRMLHMRALALSGRQGEAMRSSGEFRKLLADELGLEPSSVFRELEDGILSHDTTTAASGLGWPSPSPQPLPLRISSFVGRSEEVAEVIAALEFFDSRLVTLVGPGGIGKTSIAIEALRRNVTETVVGYVSIDQAPRDSLDQLTARCLGLRPGPGVKPIDLIATRLEAAPHILLFDGCEQRVEEAARLLSDLLEKAPCQVVATSRLPLGIVGERQVRVGPLDDPAAVALFRDRSGLSRPLDEDDRSAVALAVEHLGGMPLAIELAAARVGPLPLHRIVERLDHQVQLLTSRDLHDRHGSLRATLDWSFDLLSSIERDTLLAVSAFRAPFSISDAEALTDEPGAEDLIAALVAASLVEPPDHSGEYRLLEPVRQYAAWRLQASGGTAEVQQHHSGWIRGSLSNLDDVMQTNAEAEALQWVYKKRGDLLAAVRAARESNNPDEVLHILAVVGHPLRATGAGEPFADPSLWAIKHPDASHGHDYFRACLGTYMFAEGRMNRDEEEAFLRTALGHAVEAGNERAQCELLHYLGMASPPHDAVSTEEKLELLDQSIDIAERIGAQNLLNRFLSNRAITLSRHFGRLDEAESTIERASELEGSDEVELLGRRLHLLSLRGDWRTAMIGYQRIAATFEERGQFFRAQGLWREAGLCAVRVGAFEQLSLARSEVERLDRVIGRYPAIPFDIEVALLDENYADVLDLARQWLGHHMPGKPTENLTPKQRWVVFGNEGHPPGLLIVLRPAAFALFHTGRPADACWIAGVLPGLLAQSPFRYMEAFGEMELWEPLHGPCGTGSPTEPHLPAPEIYRRLIRVIGTTPPNPDEPMPRLYEY